MKIKYYHIVCHLYDVIIQKGHIMRHSRLSLSYAVPEDHEWYVYITHDIYISYTISCASDGIIVYLYCLRQMCICLYAYIYECVYLHCLCIYACEIVLLLRFSCYLMRARVASQQFIFVYNKVTGWDLYPISHYWCQVLEYWSGAKSI